MKVILLGMCFSLPSLMQAQTLPDAALVARYLEASHAEQNLSARLSGYIQQFSAGETSADARAQFARRVYGSMGWGVVHDDVAAIVAKTYTAEELQAALLFLESPEGRSFAEKNASFEEQLAKQIEAKAPPIAKPTVAASPTPGASFSPGFPVGTMPSVSDIGFEGFKERNLDGRVQFIGQIVNQGKTLVHGMQVAVDLYQAGEFADQCVAFVMGSIAPGAKRNVKVACGTKDFAPDRHDSFKVEALEVH